MHDNIFYPGHDPKYALVDAFYHGIWFVDDNENFCHRLGRCFRSKVNLIVYDLRSFTGWQKDLIDNHVCLDWQISSTKRRELIQSKSYAEMPGTQIADPSQKLINQTPDMPWLDTSDRLELQHQMMLYRYLNLGDDIEDQIQDLVDTVFQQEIDHRDIVDRLREIEFKDLYRSSHGRRILRTTGRLYG